ncbi:Na+/H+ antiporter NhaA [Nakamurella lactea]|uniref:Na+/H+ antiporter NhaA n=1 Tax=Nakamurella lactea TaxID=459515 RepID=UPI00048F485E|nr:Na+/H+ antiporter NhaA [Nakamurella lactea]
MTDVASTWSGHTAWARGRAGPLRAFLRTESGSASVLVAAVAVALLWVNVDQASYAAVWHTELSIRLGSVGLSYDLQTWVNSGLMTLFFLVVGLEARREIDLGDLRERRRFILPLAAGLAGMVVPVALFLVINAGRPSAHGWGVAMSTDTALALGLLALLGRNVPDRVRIFLLTVFVVDDVAALVVIVLVYSDHIAVVPVVVAIALFVALLVLARLRVRGRWIPAVLGLGIWVALMDSGVDPVVAGLAIGLAAPAYSPSRGDLEEATGRFRAFREQPTPELARSASSGLTATLSLNDRLQTLYHPWTSYLIVPLFALANAGIVLNGGFLAHAYAAPVTLGVIIGYVVGKPIAVVTTARAVTWITHGRVRPPVGWAAVLGSGTIAGIGFTVTLLIASLAFTGPELNEAKLGALTAAAVASLLTWIVYRLTALLPPAARTRALQGDPRLIQDLIPEVDPLHDHIRGSANAAITLIEFGDFECPHCGEAEPVVRELLADQNLRYVWRHLPLTDVHPRAQLAAEAAEAAASQGAFWPMHDVLFAHQDELRAADLQRYAGDLGLNVDRFRDDLAGHVHATRIAQDVESADVSGASGTPTFFVNGQRHYGAFDLETLSAAIRTARDRHEQRQ